MGRKIFALFLLFLWMGCSQKNASPKKTSSLEEELEENLSSEEVSSPKLPLEKPKEVVVRPLPRPKVGNSPVDITMRKFLAVLHRKEINDLMGFLNTLEKVYVLRLRKRKKGSPPLYYVLTEERRRRVTLVAFTREDWAKAYRDQALKRPEKWMVVDFEVPEALRVARASRQYYIAEQGRRYYVEQMWVNPLAGGKDELRIPLREIDKNFTKWKRLFSRRSNKLYFLYRREKVSGKPVPYYGFDPKPVRWRFLAIPVFIREDLAKYHWSHMGKRAKFFGVASLPVEEFLEELYRMRKFWRRIRGRKYYLRKVWWNPSFREIECKISVKPFWVIRAYLKKQYEKFSRPR